MSFLVSSSATLSLVHGNAGYAGQVWGPPSTRSTWLLMYDASSETRKATTEAISIGLPNVSRRCFHNQAAKSALVRDVVLATATVI